MTAHYSHEDHASRCAVAAYKGESLALRQTFVQARVGRTECCARIVTAWDTSDRLEMWQLDLISPIKGRLSTPAYNVRACSGIDGRCTCAPADPFPVTPDAAPFCVVSAAGRAELAMHAPAARSADVSTLPVGNHGETLSETTK